MSAMPSLRDRISGPNARPIAQLVAMGERASERVQESFHDFLAQRVLLLEQFLPGLNPASGDGASALRNFFTIVHDIRGSSALAQNSGVNRLCASFETLLQARDHDDPRMPAAIRSHIDAISLVAHRRGGDAALDILASQLARAVEALPVRMQDLRAPTAVAHP